METLRTLPGDDVRQILWRFADRFDLQMLVQSARSVARGPVARLVAEGARNSHEWTEQKAQLLTNMGFATFVTAAVDSGDDRIKGSCMVILEEKDPGVFDRGVPTRKLVHQLSSTRDSVFSLRVPASRIVGGYTVTNGVIVPRYSHGEVIEAVFRRTRVTVGLMTSAKLLPAVEPVIRYQRGRFRGGETTTPGSPRYELGLQQKEDVLHRLVDAWATGEAGASLGFAAARLFDELDPLERRKDEIFAQQGIGGGSAQVKALRADSRTPPKWLRSWRRPSSPSRAWIARACSSSGGGSRRHATPTRPCRWSANGLASWTSSREWTGSRSGTTGRCGSWSGSRSASARSRPAPDHPPCWAGRLAICPSHPTIPRSA